MTYEMARQISKFYPGRRQALLLVLIVAAIYVLLPQVGAFHSSWKVLAGAKAGFIVIAAALIMLTFAAAAGTYRFLAFRPIGYTPTLLIELAANFVNRLLPAGIGALGANYLYLRHNKHSAAQAGSVAAVNNLLGFIGHFLLLAAVLTLFSGRSFSSGSWEGPNPAFLLKTAAALIGILVIAAVVFGSRRLNDTLSNLKRQLFSYRRRPLSLAAALMTSLALTLCNVLCLYACLYALDLHLPFALVSVVFTFGISAGSVAPTPGGLGAFEAGLAAGFVAYGVNPAHALAAALLFRLISYWLPLIIGAGAFIVCQRRKLFEI